MATNVASGSGSSRRSPESHARSRSRASSSHNRRLSMATPESDYGNADYETRATLGNAPATATARQARHAKTTSQSSTASSAAAHPRPSSRNGQHGAQHPHTNSHLRSGSTAHATVPSTDSSTSPSALCSFCLVAEFDIDKGSTLSHQYPAPTGHDEHMLAELMLPDGVHARTEDWTVFFLSRQSDSNRPKTPGDEAQSVDTSAAESVEKAKGRENLTYVLNLVRTKHDNTVRRGALVKAIAIGTRHPYIQAFRPALLLAIDEYFRTPEIDVLARLYDALNSFDMTAVPSFSFNEKLILRATDRRNMFEERFGDQWLSTAPLDARNANGNSLAEYGASNDSAQDPRSASMSRSKDPSGSDNSSYSHDEFLSHMQQQSPDAGNTSSFRPRVKQKPSFPSLRQNYSSGGAASHLGGGLGGKRLPSGPNPPHIEPKGGVGLEASLPKDTHIFETFVMYGKTTEIPIRIPTDLFDQEVGEYSLLHLINTFGNSTPIGPQHPHLHSNGNLTPTTIVLFNAVITGKRIIFLGHNLPALQVASHVLSLCALGSGCGAAWQGVIGRCFPYANLGMLDELEQVPGYIAGVTNPRFEELRAWDILCNIETGKITIAKDIEPAAPLRPHPEPSLSSTFSSGSLGAGVGPEGEARLMRHPSETDAVPTTSIQRSGRDRNGTVAEARSDAADVVFMEEIQTAIANRYGERYVRLRFLEYALQFVRTAARHEEYFYGQTTLAPPSQPFLNGQLGSGIMCADRDAETRHIMANAMRVEGWRATNAFSILRQEHSLLRRSQAILGFDLGHQLARLRRASKLNPNESELLFIRIARGIKTPDQITELLALLPPHRGGLLPISNGLFHPSAPVRHGMMEMLSRMLGHPAGRKFIQSLNTFHRLAFARSLQERREMLARAQAASLATGKNQDHLLHQSSNNTYAEAQRHLDNGTMPLQQPAHAMSLMPKDNGQMQRLDSSTASDNGAMLAGGKREYGLGIPTNLGTHAAASSSSLGLGLPTSVLPGNNAHHIAENGTQYSRGHAHPSANEL